MKNYIVTFTDNSRISIISKKPTIDTEKSVIVFDDYKNTTYYPIILVKSVSE